MRARITNILAGLCVAALAASLPAPAIAKSSSGRPAHDAGSEQRSAKARSAKARARARARAKARARARQRRAGTATRGGGTAFIPEGALGPRWLDAETAAPGGGPAAPGQASPGASRPGSTPPATGGSTTGPDAGGTTPAGTSTPLVGGLGVVAREWSLQPTRTTTSAGTYNVQLQNYGEDPHDLVIQRNSDSAVVWHFAEVAAAQPGRPTVATKQLDLPAGGYTLFCSLPGHAGRGMTAPLTVSP